MTSTPARITLGTLLDRADAGAFTVTRSAYDARQVLPSHAHAAASAMIMLRGNVIERVGGRRFECGGDRMLLRPAAVEHANVYGPAGAECLIITVHNESSALETTHAVFDAPRLVATVPARALGRRIRRELAIGDHASPLAIEGMVLELIALLTRGRRDRSRPVAPSWLRGVRDRLRDESRAPAARLTTVARDAGVHPVYLARAFRAWFGCSPGDYVRQCRIDRVCAELTTSTRSIAEVAMNAGFASPSHLATAFRRATGMSPSAYRAATRSRSGRRFES